MLFKKKTNQTTNDKNMDICVEFVKNNMHRLNLMAKQDMEQSALVIYNCFKKAEDKCSKKSMDCIADKLDFDKLHDAIEEYEMNYKVYASSKTLDPVQPEKTVEEIEQEIKEDFADVNFEMLDDNDVNSVVDTVTKNTNGAFTDVKVTKKAKRPYHYHSANTRGGKTTPVKNDTTGEIFDSMKEACEKYNIKCPSLSYAIKRGNRCAGCKWSRI